MNQPVQQQSPPGETTKMTPQPDHGARYAVAGGTPVL
jgi:hypothetical protein